MADDNLTLLIGVPAGSKPAVLARLGEAFDVVARTDSFGDLLAQAIELVPDVILIDDALGRDELAAFITRVGEATPASRVVVTTSIDDATTFEFVRAGAFCVVHTNAAATAIETAVRGAVRGEAVLSPFVALSVARELQALRAEGPNPPYRPPSLTTTETEVLTLLSKGKSSETIGEQHDVTARLVNLHTGYAVGKLHNHLKRERTLALSNPM